MNKEKNFLDDNMDYSCDEYCNKKCEFYEYCYANHEFCIKQTFKDIFLHTLTPREGKIVKMFYGWNGSRRYTFEEISKEFVLTRERIRQIYAKAMRKLRRLDKRDVLNECLYEIYSLEEKTFYYEIIKDIFDEFSCITLQFALYSDIDISIIDINNCTMKTITEIKTELNKKIIDIEALKPFYKALKDISTLNQLLHTSKSKLLFEILKDDVLYFDMISTLSSMGYRVKGSGNMETFDLTLAEKLKSVVVDSNVYKKSLDELPLMASMLLFTKDIKTIGDLLLKYNEICFRDKIDTEIREQVEEFLVNKGLIVLFNEKKICMTDAFWDCYLKKLVIWMRENSYSIISLISQLEKSNESKNNLFFDFVNKQYPQFEYLSYNEIAVKKDMLIEELDLSVRSFNCLKRVGLDTINDVVAFLESGGIARNLGRKGLEEVIYKLSQLGVILNFSNEPQYFL